MLNIKVSEERDLSSNSDSVGYSLVVLGRSCNFSIVQFFICKMGVVPTSIKTI